MLYGCVVAAGVTDGVVNVVTDELVSSTVGEGASRVVGGVDRSVLRCCVVVAGVMDRVMMG